MLCFAGTVKQRDQLLISPGECFTRNNILAHLKVLLLLWKSINTYLITLKQEKEQLMFIISQYRVTSLVIPGVSRVTNETMRLFIQKEKKITIVW